MLVVPSATILESLKYSRKVLILVDILTLSDPLLSKFPAHPSLSGRISVHIYGLWPDKQISSEYPLKLALLFKKGKR